MYTDDGNNGDYQGDMDDSEELASPPWLDEADAEADAELGFLEDILDSIIED